MLRPVETISRHGGLCDARRPAPVGAATVEAVWVVQNALSAALSRMKACAPDQQGEDQAVSCGPMTTVNMGGDDQYGQRHGVYFAGAMMRGFGVHNVELPSASVRCEGIDRGCRNPCTPCVDIHRVLRFYDKN